MKPLLAYAALGLGATGLFGGAFLGFTYLSAGSLHHIPLLGSKTEEPDEHHEAPTTAEHAVHEEPAKPAEASALELGVLGSFLIPSPFTAKELSDLEQRLETGRAEIDARQARVVADEVRLGEWERSLEERYGELEKLRADLEEREQGLARREAELRGDEQESAQHEQQSWKELSQFFADGDPAEAVLKLVQFTPEEAAKILRGLEPERAGELVNALPPERYREYLDAYRSAVP